MSLDRFRLHHFALVLTPSLTSTVFHDILWTPYRIPRRPRSKIRRSIIRIRPTNPPPSDSDTPPITRTTTRLLRTRSSTSTTPPPRFSTRNNVNSNVLELLNERRSPTNRLNRISSTSMDRQWSDPNQDWRNDEAAARNRMVALSSSTLDPALPPLTLHANTLDCESPRSRSTKPTRRRYSSDPTFDLKRSTDRSRCMEEDTRHRTRVERVWSRCGRLRRTITAFPIRRTSPKIDTSSKSPRIPTTDQLFPPLLSFRTPPVESRPSTRNPSIRTAPIFLTTSRDERVSPFPPSLPTDQSNESPPAPLNENLDRTSTKIDRLR